MIKFRIKEVLKNTPFSLTSMGFYLRQLYWRKYLDKIPTQSFTHVLDAGCGTGDYAKKFALKYPHSNVRAYDLKKYKSWNKKPINVHFSKKNLLYLKESNYYDFCYSIDVLEHISGNYNVLLNFYRALKPGGYLLLHIPNKFQRRIFSKKYFMEQKRWGESEHIGELYSITDLKKILTSIGFKTVTSQETFGFFGKLAWEIDIIIHKKTILKLFLMPILKLIAFVELFNKNIQNGNGILILATKIS